MSQQFIVGIIVMAGGLLLFAAALMDWAWLYRMRRAAWWVNTFGQQGARWIFMALGGGVILLGLIVTTRGWIINPGGVIEGEDGYFRRDGQLYYPATAQYDYTFVPPREDVVIKPVGEAYNREVLTNKSRRVGLQFRGDGQANAVFVPLVDNNPSVVTGWLLVQDIGHRQFLVAHIVSREGDTWSIQRIDPVEI